MDLKKLFNNNKAVSPVIGVVLMVAITVILAAAIGSSVFGQGTTESAPQANINIESAGVDSATPAVASLTFEHLGGDTIHFDQATTTKVFVEKEGISYEVDATDIGIFDVGGVHTLDLVAVTGVTLPTFASGEYINVRVVDVKTQQLICDKDIRL